VINAFHGRRVGDPGYTGLLRSARQCSAVSGGCLLIDRAAFAKAGGMEPARFPEWFADADLCLRLRAEGFEIVFTPHAELRWAEPADGVATGSAGIDEARQRECDVFRRRWALALGADPFYHPALSAEGPGYEWAARIDLTDRVRDAMRLRWIDSPAWV
jgi:O-antigen biosynthesis protein